MKKLLFGLLGVVLLGVAAFAQEKSVEEKVKPAEEEKPPVVTVLKKGEKPFYNLSLKYSPGKYRVTKSADYRYIYFADVKAKPEMELRYKAKDVFTVEASKPDDKGQQTLKIFVDDIYVSYPQIGEHSASRKQLNDKKKSQPKTAADEKDVDETDLPENNVNSREKMLQDRMEQAIESVPMTVVLDSAGKTVSTSGGPREKKSIMLMIDDVYEGLDKSNSYPEIGLGGSFQVEMEYKMFKKIPMKSTVVMTLERIEKCGEDTIGYFKAETKYKNAKPVSKDKKTADPLESSTVKGHSNGIYVINLTKRIVTESNGNSVVRILPNDPSQKIVDIKSQGSSKYELLK